MSIVFATSLTNGASGASGSTYSSESKSCYRMVLFKWVTDNDCVLFTATFLAISDSISAEIFFSECFLEPCLKVELFFSGRLHFHGKFCSMPIEDLIEIQSLIVIWKMTKSCFSFAIITRDCSFNLINLKDYTFVTKFSCSRWSTPKSFMLPAPRWECGLSLGSPSDSMSDELKDGFTWSSEYLLGLPWNNSEKAVSGRPDPCLLIIRNMPSTESAERR